MPFVKKFPPEVYEYIKTCPKGTPSKVQQEIKNRFGVDVSIGMIQFQLHPEYGKTAKAKRIALGKNKLSWLNRPVGSVRYNDDGYAMIMVSEGKERLRSRVVWENAGNPPLKDNEALYHLDGDRGNDSLDNLMLIKREYMGAISHYIEPEMSIAQRRAAINAGILMCEANKLKAKMKIKPCNKPTSKYWRDVITLNNSGYDRQQIAGTLGIKLNSVKWILLQYKRGRYDAWL